MMKRFGHFIVLISIFSLFIYGCGGSGGGNTPSSTDNNNNVTDGQIKTYDLPGSMPTNLAIDGSNNVWITNTASNTVTKLNSSGNVLGSYAVGDGPNVIAVDNSNNIWVGSSSGLTLLNNVGSFIASNNSTTFDSFAVNTSGNIITQNEYSILLTDMSNGNIVSKLLTIDKWIRSFTIDNSNNIWVCTSENKIKKYSYSGKFLAEYKDSSFNYNSNYGNCITSDSDGNIWILNNSSVTKLNPSGVQVANYAIPNNAYPTSIAVDGNDHLWVATHPILTNYTTSLNEKAYFDNIYEIDSNGTQIASYQQYADLTVGNMVEKNLIGITPYAIAIDGLGNVWVLDGYHDKVSKIEGVATAVSTP